MRAKYKFKFCNLPDVERAIYNNDVDDAIIYNGKIFNYYDVVDPIYGDDYYVEHGAVDSKCNFVDYLEQHQEKIYQILKILDQHKKYYKPGQDNFEYGVKEDFSDLG